MSITLCIILNWQKYAIARTVLQCLQINTATRCKRTTRRKTTAALTDRWRGWRLWTHSLTEINLVCVLFFFNEDNQFKCICLSGSSLATTMMSSWGLKQSNQLADYLWPHNCYSFTMCFGWVSTYIPGLVSMPMILRQPVIGLLTAASAIFNFHFRFWCSSHIAILLAVGA